MVYTYPQRYPELAYYRNYIMQQDRKFIWPAVQMYDIGYCAMCAHCRCPFTKTDQALMATLLDATAVKASAQKCFHCRGFDHLVGGCPFPHTASLQTVETTKKSAQARWTSKPGLAKYSSLTQSDKWFHNRREGCNDYQQDRCTFPHCKWAHICCNCKQEHPASQCSFGGTVITTSQ